MTLDRQTHCLRCGTLVPPAQPFCPRCGAPLTVPAPVEDGWPEAPSGLAQVMYILLAVFGALLILGGAGYILLVLILGGAGVDTALALSVLATGLVMGLHSLRAFQPTRWQRLPRGQGWGLLAFIVLVWLLGLGLQTWLPGLSEWLLPPLIVVGAWLPPRFFLAAAQYGLITPAGRKILEGRLVPRHLVMLAISLSASLSIGLALAIEFVALAVVMIIVLVVTQYLGGELSIDLLRSAIDDPLAQQRLVEVVSNSPGILLALGLILVIIAPAIEELVKAIPLLLFARRRAQLSERMAILLGVAGGVGFAFAENVGYLGTGIEDWPILFWFRTAAAVMHGAASGFVGRAWYQGAKCGRWGTMLVDLLIGWGIHAFWNALALVYSWFAYREVTEGALFVVGVGLMPLAILFVILARWGIWVRE